MDGLKAVLTRRSIRAYTDERVSDAVTENLLRAGMYAPSAMNSQPWEFLVIRGAEKKKAASVLSANWKVLAEAPLGILVMANLNDYKASSSDYFIQDCSAATENILLAAHAQGLGGVWLGLYPKQDRMQGLRDIFSIPEHIIPFSLISIGYPAETKRPHGSYHAGKVHFDKY